MKQLLVGEPDADGVILIEGGDYRHLARSRRVRLGDELTVAPGGGETRRARVIAIDGRRLRALCLPSDTTDDNDAVPDTKTPMPETGLPSLILFQALPKCAKMDLIVRQAAECAVAEIVPFVSDYSVAKGAAEKTERWRRIVKEARQQSGSNIDTKIHEVCGRAEALSYWKERQQQIRYSAAVLFYEVPCSEAAAPLEKNGLHRYLYGEPDLVAFAIGPEGGFSAGEAREFVDVGFRCVTMGQSILRTETAAVYAAAACRIILMERSLWTLKMES
jgi:16S rRNA (uracil1498-N3)-methyltransferase